MNRPTARYVFVGDQGSVCSSADQPTREDFAQAGVGIVTIVDVQTGRYYGRGSRWRPIPPALLAPAIRDTSRSPRIHAA